jgi:cytochrome oxidase assembly protein ShyY1
VVGLLQPSEPPSQLAPGQDSGLPADQVHRVAVAELVNRWPYPLITGFVVQQTQTPATGPTPTPVPAPTMDDGLDLQNLSYAVQWWVFAGLGLFFWWRLVRDDHRDVSRLSVVDLQNTPR